MKSASYAPAFALATLLASAPAMALDVPPGLTFCNGSGSTSPSQQCGRGVAQASASLVSLTALASINLAAPMSASMSAGLRYYVGIDPGPSFVGSLRIPMLLHSAGYAEKGPAPTGSDFNHNNAFASVSGFGISAGVDTRLVGFGQRVAWDETSAVTVTVSDNPRFNIHEVNVLVSADANASTPTSYAIAFADPTISIEPTFAAAHPEFRLVFSSNVSPVPEPGTGALWLAGAGVLVGVVRRRA